MIKDIMSKKIIFSNINDSIKDVSEIMKKNNIGFVPIKDNGKYIGVITDRDICLSIPNLNSINDSVKSYINNNTIYIDINANIEEALNLMSKYKVKRLLVKEKDNTIGVLSLSDIINYSDNTNIITACKSIFYIHDNNKSTYAEIDSFYL
ncbi:MAG: CBS domain-containing protein [bacterium]|nr:CBS domain-containing protein [bacterium]